MKTSSTIEYFNNNKLEIDKQNLKYLKNLSFFGIIFLTVFSIYFLIVGNHEVLLIKYFVSIIFYVIFLIFVYLYNKRDKINHYITDMSVIIFMAYSLGFASSLAIPNMNAFSVMLPMFIIALATAFILKWYKYLIINIIVTLVYFLIIIFYKEKSMSVVFVDAQNTITAIALAVILQNLSQRLRIREYKSREKLEKISAIDELTNLPNRRMLDKYLGFRNEDKDISCIGVLMIDIDDFKVINDTYGHLVGDKVLREFGIVINKLLLENKGVFVSRYGGEEFVVVSNVLSKDEIKQIAENLREDIRNMEIFELKDRVITISIGLCYYDNVENVNFLEVIDASDKALYHSKVNGKDCITDYDDIKEKKNE